MRMPCAPGPSSQRVAPIRALSGRQKVRCTSPVSGPRSSESQGESANRFWRVISTYLRCGSGCGRAVRPRCGGRTLAEVRAASSLPESCGDPTRSTAFSPRLGETPAWNGHYHATPAPPSPRGGALTITDRPEESLAVHGLRVVGRVLRNPTTSQLYAAALDRGEGVIAEDGPLVVDTGRFTGRSPKDKFVVREPGSEERIWWSETNGEISEEHFDGLRAKVVAHLEDGDVYVIDAFCGADPKHRLSLRVLTTHPYHALFAKTMFIEPGEAELADFEPDVLVLHEPEVEADPAHHGTRTEGFICPHPTRQEILIGGTV